MSVSRNRKVNFFEIINPEGCDRKFEEIMCDIMNIPLENRKHFQSGVDLDEYYVLSEFDKVNDNSNLYKGIFSKCSANSITASNEGRDELKESKIDEGYRPAHISHFIYSPSKRILSIESSQQAPKQPSLLRYCLYMQANILQRELIKFECYPIIDENIANIIRSANGVRAFEFSLSCDELTSIDKNGNWMGLISKLAGQVNAGKITLGFSGARKRGDMTEVISTEQLADEFDKGEFKHVTFGSLHAELIYDQQAIVVNLLQNKLKSDIQVPTADISNHSSDIFKQIIDRYEKNKKLLVPARRSQLEDLYGQN